MSGYQSSPARKSPISSRQRRFLIVDVVDKNADSVILECKLTEHRNDDLIALLKSQYKHISVVRGGAVAIEAMSTGCR